MTRLALVALGAAVAVLVALDLACGPAGPDAERPLTVPDVAAPIDPAAWTVLVDLAGRWDFRIGDAPADAGAWGPIAAPGAWEDQGYHGYDGVAWYRTAFALDPDALKAADLAPHLLLGRIDDVDEVWLNGVRVGATGSPPPAYRTASFGFRTYPLPRGLLRADKPNEVLVRVYDAGLAGGILEGPLAVAVPSAQNPAGAPVVADLAGTWRFAPGDGDWAAPDHDDAAWDSLRVPGYWEAQGYRQLGGLAWYRKAVELSAATAAQDLVLVLGAVDDLDQAFVNGVLVGQTGDPGDPRIAGDEWLRERAYPVPAGTLRPGRNVVAVRVYDGPVDGGIHRGPVALMTPEAYAERVRRARRDTR